MEICQNLSFLGPRPSASRASKIHCWFSSIVRLCPPDSARNLFMSSRDRLSKRALRFAVEKEIEEILRMNPKLRKLQEQRRFQDVESKLSEEKPLEEVLQRIFKASPTLQTLFLVGRRLARPFAKGGAGKDGKNGGP